MPSSEEYLRHLQALLPPGPAFSRDPDAVVTGLLFAWADELARIDARGLDLIDEADVRTAVELLPDWERVLGLPDACTAGATTTSGRQVACWQKLAGIAGQTKAFYIALAAQLGATIEINEFDTGAFGNPEALVITGGRWRFVWNVHVVSSVDYTVFRVGSSGVGDRLIDGGQLDLECVLNAAKPAHTHIVFTYEEEE